jgi:hypothetical protein
MLKRKLIVIGFELPSPLRPRSHLNAAKHKAHVAKVNAAQFILDLYISSIDVTPRKD